MIRESRRLTLKDCEFKVSLGYLVNLRPAWAPQGVVSKTEQNKTNSQSLKEANNLGVVVYAFNLSI